jgi:hypothetical protein
MCALMGFFLTECFLPQDRSIQSIDGEENELLHLIGLDTTRSAPPPPLLTVRLGTGVPVLGADGNGRRYKEPIAPYDGR